MAEITNIIATRKGRRREREVYLDGEHVLTISEETYLKVGLSTGQMLDEAQVREIETIDGLARAREAALRLLNYRMRTRHELKQRLAQKGWSTDVITRVLDSLEQANLIDDAQFARLWIDERLRLKPSGTSLLRRELRRKGIDGEIIEKALQDRTDDSDEATRAYELLQRRWTRYAKLERDVANRRMIGFLSRRGFNSHDIFTAIKRIFNE